MSVVTIDYGNLNSMIVQDQNICAKMDDYSDVIDRQFINKLSSLQGDDSAGNISTAMTLARQKKNKLSGYKTNFQQLKTALTNLKNNAQYADSIVKANINILADPYEQKQNFFQKIGSTVYGFFSDVASLLSESFLGEIFVNAVSKVWTLLKMAKEMIADWFKYGAGKYVANILLAVTAVIGVVTAIAGAIASAPVWLATVAIVAGVCALVYATGNMMVAIKKNVEAMKYHKEGRLGMARYYGAQTTVKTWSERTDFGGAKANAIMEWMAAGYDYTGKVATVVLTICTMTNGILKLDEVKNSTTGQHIRYQEIFHKDGSINNVIKNNLDDKLGFHGLGQFLFGESKSYIPTDYKSTKNLLSLIKTTIETPLQTLGGKTSSMDILSDAWKNPSPKTVIKSIKSITGNFFTPDYVQSNTKSFLPIGLFSDTIDLYESGEGLIGKTRNILKTIFTKK